MRTGDVRLYLAHDPSVARSLVGGRLRREFAPLARIPLTGPDKRAVAAGVYEIEAEIGYFRRRRARPGDR